MWRAELKPPVRARKSGMKSISLCEPKPKKQKNVQKAFSKKFESEQNVDKYCWLCHTKASEKTCGTCRKAFHESCLNKASTSFSRLGHCPECQWLSVTGTELKPSKFLNLEKLKKMLEVITCENIKKEKDKSSKFLHMTEEHRDKLFKLMDFEILVANIIQCGIYKKPIEFYTDVKFIYHNSCVVHGIDSDEAKTADSFRKNVENELIALEACPECYYYMNCDNQSLYSLFINPFLHICESPHDIVWAHLKTWSYWPAKCLKAFKGAVGGSDDYVYVRFFGKHEHAYLPISDCLFLSKSHPKDETSDVESETNPGPKTKLYKAANAELLEYIDLYKQKYGDFPFHTHKTLYKPQEIYEVPEPSTEESSSRRLVQMNREANTHEVSEEYALKTRVEDSEDKMRIQNFVPNDISTPIDNVTNAISTQSNSLPIIGRVFLADAGSQIESEDEVQCIEQKNVQGDSNPDVVLPILIQENPQLRDLVEKTRYYSDAMIAQLCASFGSSYGTGEISKLNDDLKNCELNLKYAKQINEELWKENEIHKQTTQELKANLTKAEADIRELESQIKIQKVIQNEQQDNARIVIDSMQNRLFKSVSQQVNTEHSRIVKEKDKTITNLKKKINCLIKEIEDFRIEKQRAEEELKTVKKQISSDTLSNYKRMHYCWVCERSAGKTCCLNTSYCSDECERTHSEEHKKYCKKDKFTSQTLVQQRVVSQQSVFMSSRGVTIK